MDTVALQAGFHWYGPGNYVDRKKDMSKAIQKGFRRSFTKGDTLFRIPHRPRRWTGAPPPYGYRILVGEQEVLHMEGTFSESDLDGRGNVLDMNVGVTGNFSRISSDLRAPLASALFSFVTYGRGFMGRESNLFLYRLVVNRVYIRFPNVARSSVESQQQEFMKAILGE